MSGDLIDNWLNKIDYRNFLELFVYVAFKLLIAELAANFCKNWYKIALNSNDFWFR